MQAPTPSTSPPQSKKLLDQVSDAIHVKHYSPRTEKTYDDRIRGCILSLEYSRKSSRIIYRER